jgi:iron-sulfur cluster assembly accessory protein
MKERTNAGVPAAALPAGSVVALTDKAIEMVKTAMRRESRGPQCILRVGVVGGGCSGFSYSMSFDEQPKADDTIVEIGGVTVVIDAVSLEYLMGTTLDYETGLHGSGFKFHNPKAQRSCGCGSSFSV